MISKLNLGMARMNKPAFGRVVKVDSNTRVVTSDVTKMPTFVVRYQHNPTMLNHNTTTATILGYTTGGVLPSFPIYGDNKIDKLAEELDNNLNDKNS